MRGPLLLSAIACSSVLAGCGDSAAPETLDASAPRSGDAGHVDAGRVTDRAPFPDAGATPFTCTLGVADDVGAWAPLAPGGEVPIGGSGQAGLTAQLAVRIEGDEITGNAWSAVLRLVLENVATGVTADAKPWDLAVTFECAEGGICDRAPVLVEVSHLAKLPELEGTSVEVRVQVVDADAPARVLCQASERGVLARR